MGRLILSINTTTLDVGFTKDMSEYRIAATSLGTSMLEKANALAFDEKTVDAAVSATTALTSASYLKAETGELTEDNFDDIDDYNNFIKYDTLSGVIYKTRVKVEYVDIVSNIISSSSSQKFNKKISVYITSDYLLNYSTQVPTADTLYFQSVFSYWYFR
ncbi:MAG: hypothetical protein WCT99_02155 [Bacteroidota bacterium]